MGQLADEYRYDTAALTDAHSYLLPAVERLVEATLAVNDRRLFDLGCGSGAAAAYFDKRGIAVVGVDPSETSIRKANRAYPNLRLEVGSAYDSLAVRFGSFPVVISLEVVEHLYAPRKFAACLFDLVQPGGTAIVSTPFHGYWKNLVLAVSGKLDRHFDPLWDHGHIKFWSEKSLAKLLTQAGFVDIHFERVGRIPALAKSMIAVAAKPGTTAATS